ncbi:polysaccharide deacetylase family protein [Paenibacillus sp. EPM92]|uniref:polysaccharide deacetylase family protein n=2 Tax=Paenibacillus TaxID=44249 RepID=UPI0011449574|nr:polysaccharide deacetylase family protein [Paenibacillus sp. EPM92]
MGMETYSTQVMELLSLGKTSDGVNQIKVVVTQEDRQATYVIDIDEFTFLGLEALRPLNGDRIRLSPYSKWDPYRNTFYSAIIRTTGVSRDTLYFPCSEEYISQIKRIRQTDLPPVPMDEGGQDGGVEKFAQRRSQFLRRFSARVPRIANLLPVMLGLLAFLSIASGGKDDSVRILSEQIGVAKAVVTTDDSNAPIVPASISDMHKGDISHAAVVADQTALTQASIQPNVNQAQIDFEVIDIDEEKKFFGLPEKYVALTFDDGPSPFTKNIVDILTEHKVAATFLFVGKNAERNPDAVTYTSEHGMSIGNHSWDHSVLTKAAPQDQSENLSKTSSVVESLTHTAVTLFRPPYGAVNDELVSAAKKQNMKILLWNRDPEDWNAKKPEDIIRYFHQVEAAGGVYVLHEDKNTVEALPDIIKYLKGKNLTFVAFK